MARRRRQNKLTLTTVIAALILLAVINLVESNNLMPENKAVEVSSQDSTVEVHFIDVGQGDSIYIKTPSQDILIDAGERGDTVVNYLNNLNVEDLELVIGTHPHSDHIGGLINVFEEIPVKEVMDPGVVHTSKTFEDYLTLIDEKDIIYTVVRAGIKRTYDDGTVLEILSPENPDEEKLNDASIAARLTFGEISFLFAGDAEVPSEKKMLEAGYNLKSTVLKAGHHGSSTSTSKEFLEAVSPEAVVIMCGAGNTYGHPHKETLAKLEAAGIKVYRTDLMGTIIVETNGSTYDIMYEYGKGN
ncbi:MAG TPA: MBL fold metallo-hydrolase [Clostridiales bacterium]|nr:MBL fold metallo-hydrolase [Clostridiales bacterium]